MRIKKLIKEKSKLVNLRIPKHELDAILERAKKYTDGNISSWLRYAGMNHTPKREELD